MAADKIGWTQKLHAAKAKEVRPGVFHGIGMAAARVQPRRGRRAGHGRGHIQR